MGLLSKFFGGRRQPTLARRCAAYLQQGPPPEMTDYVPGSLTELVIGVGARNETLDAEWLQIGGIILHSGQKYEQMPEGPERDFILLGQALVREVLELSRSRHQIEVARQRMPKS